MTIYFHGLSFQTGRWALRPKQTEIGEGFRVLFEKRSHGFRALLKFERSSSILGFGARQPLHIRFRVSFMLYSTRVMWWRYFLLIFFPFFSLFFFGRVGPKQAGKQASKQAKK